VKVIKYESIGQIMYSWGVQLVAHQVVLQDVATFINYTYVLYKVGG